MPCYYSVNTARSKNATHKNFLLIPNPNPIRRAQENAAQEPISLKEQAKSFSNIQTSSNPLPMVMSLPKLLIMPPDLLATTLTITLGVEDLGQRAVHGGALVLGVESALTFLDLAGRGTTARLLGLLAPGAAALRAGVLGVLPAGRLGRGRAVAALGGPAARALAFGRWGWAWVLGVLLGVVGGALGGGVGADGVAAAVAVALGGEAVEGGG